jgi:hypothetical protein
MGIPQGTAFEGVRAAELVSETDRSSFWRADAAGVVVEPAGRIALPPCVITNRDRLPRPVHGTLEATPDGLFASAIDFPPMVISKFHSAYCLPFGAPMLAGQRKIVSDFLIPWSPAMVGWFVHEGGSAYRTDVMLDTDNPDCELDIALYLDHPVIGHYGHFIADCLSRIYAWEICRSLFGQVKVVIADTRHPDTYHTRLLNAAGVPTEDIVKIRGLTHCRTLLLATNALAVLQYVSPTAPRVWTKLRDAMAGRDISMPDRVYFSRAGVADRRLINEADVEDVFRRHGFAVARPEDLPVEMQATLACNARLIAGTSGSNMFNLAFQARARSVFVMAPDFYVGPSEQYFCAGHFCDLRYHIGEQIGPDTDLGRRQWSVDTARLADEVQDWLTETGG